MVVSLPKYSEGLKTKKKLLQLVEGILLRVYGHLLRHGAIGYEHLNVTTRILYFLWFQCDSGAIARFGLARIVIHISPEVMI